MVPDMMVTEPYHYHHHYHHHHHHHHDHYHHRRHNHHRMNRIADVVHWPTPKWLGSSAGSSPGNSTLPTIRCSQIRRKERFVSKRFIYTLLDSGNGPFRMMMLVLRLRRWPRVTSRWHTCRFATPPSPQDLGGGGCDGNGRVESWLARCMVWIWVRRGCSCADLTL